MRRLFLARNVAHDVRTSPAGAIEFPTLQPVTVKCGVTNIVLADQPQTLV
jgi:hypothetical protein